MNASLGPRQLSLRRSLDVACALAGLALLSPVLVTLALWILLCDGAPVLFSQVRVGRLGKHFRIWKFRTMRPGAAGGSITAAGDARITAAGAVLRKFKLDELPQLFNVLVGHMSIVGPRPIVEAEVEKYQENFGVYAAGRPGLTGLWQVKGRNTTTYEQRVAYDVEYLRNWSFFRDIGIILVTVAHVIEGKGAY